MSSSITESVALLILVHIVGFVKVAAWISVSCSRDLSKFIQGFIFKLLYGFVEIDKWISLNWYIDLSKMIPGVL